MKTGDQVLYRGALYWVISVQGEIIEVAPTQHGAGSFYVTRPYLQEAA